MYNAEASKEYQLDKLETEFLFIKHLLNKYNVAGENMVVEKF
jgi:hypothetical protein